MSRYGFDTNCETATSHFLYDFKAIKRVHKGRSELLTDANSNILRVLLLLSRLIIDV